MEVKAKGEIYRVSGPVVTAEGISPRMYDVVLVGHEKLMGEVIRLEGDKSTIQVYEDTSGIMPGEPVENTGASLSVELGPGLLRSIYDGIQRPLPVLRDSMGDYILRGVTAPGLDHTVKWDFKATAKAGDEVNGGDILGTVQETPTIVHKILVPPKVSGKIKSIKKGKYTVDEVIGTLEDGTELQLMHKWPVREPRPFSRKHPPDIPLVTGTRILDSLFPIAKGGTAAIPGGFGTGKTVIQQTLAKWSDAQIVVYVGCGERGNEMTEVLTDFPHLKDPKTGGPLMDRTILIANTSNMPVAAREASVYTGITMAEYYRDQGYDVSLMADSTSRWAEAMREISSRLEEMPGEEGYPAYLGRRLAEFYERSGKSILISPEQRQGSLTLIGAVSPPGGDFSEPVSQNTLRVTRVFWALDASLANRRHFPSINWLTSYSLYVNDLSDWYASNISKDWVDLRKEALEILQRESELQEIVQLVGYDALPEPEKGILDTARSIREDYLQQSAFDEVDTYTSIKKQYQMLQYILKFGRMESDAIKNGSSAAKVSSLESRGMIPKMKWTKEEELEQLVNDLKSKMNQEFDNLSKEVSD